MLEFLRRFGLQLDYCGLPTLIDNVAFLLRIWTVNIKNKYTQRIPISSYIITLLACGSYFYVYVFSMLWFIFVRCQETGDMAAACIIFCLTACSGTGIAKLIYMHIYSDAVKNIVEKYLACDASIETGTRFSSNLLKALRVVKKRAIYFWLYLTINGSIYIVTPIFLPGRHFAEDLYIVYGLEPMFESPNYEIAFAMMSAGAFCGVSPVTNTSTFFSILTGYTEALMMALSEELDKLWDDAKASYQAFLEHQGNEDNKIGEKILNEYIEKQLRYIVEKHVMCINLLSQFEDMFRGAMTVEFSLLTSGVIAELLGGLEKTFVQVPYSLTQVTMNCLIGQRLIDASLILEKAIYSCNWEHFNKSNQKTVYLMLMNSQKTLTVSVGGLTILSFAYLMSVLKSIYSVYAALRSRM
ncbi:odorant receptor 30a-like [Epargyreus clarus]|uniref:odorant receptor 30a-like n=1 Tax=Epargyreus clarus TaxID=520877 RepID=UPI003C2D3FA4